MRRAVYPGTFDPITKGHLDLIDRGRTLFDELVVAVARNPEKSPLFSVEERVEMIREQVRSRAGVEVDAFSGLVVEYARKRGSRFILRGLRTVSDFEYEYQMALTNRVLCSDVDTVFVMPSEEYAYVRSSLIKDIIAHGGDVSPFVPRAIEERLASKLRGGS